VRISARSMETGLYLVLAAALFLPGPLYAQSIEGHQNAAGTKTSQPSTQDLDSVPSGYRAESLHIGPGDLISVAVFDVAEMAQTLRVNDRGDALLHLIGSMHLAGLTTDEASAQIRQRLKDGNYILDPQVSILITEYGTQGVSVLGEVNKPGVYPVLGHRSFLDIISQAGGTTATAGPSATVKHMDGTVATVPLTRNTRDVLAGDIELLPGDKVIVPRAGLIFVLGDVIRPGGFLMDNGRITILQALSLAGGFSKTASMHHVRLIRKNGNDYAEVAVPLKKLMHDGGGDMPLQAEDILYIPSSTTKSLLYRTVPGVVSSASSAVIYSGIP
jgi:polysaccharide biosynthesis/export protein